MLYRKLPSGRYREAAIEEVHEAALEYVRTRFQRGRTVANPKDSAELLTLEFAKDEAERFVCLFLDNRHRIIAIKTLSTGTIDGAAVHPREVVKAALKHNAAAMIVAHNHVSGVVEPSQADEQITRRLRSALALVDIRLLDHLIVGGNEWLSLAERGIT